MSKREAGSRTPVHSWQLDDTEPLISPHRVMDYYRRIPGVEASNLELPDLLVATFQQQALEHMARRTGAGGITRWPTPIFWPLGRGKAGERDLAIARLPIGAPAAAAALELMLAAGVTTVLLVGSAGSITPDLDVGSLVIPITAVRHEGTSHHYLPPDEPASAAPELVAALSASALRRRLPRPAHGPTWTTDAIYRECEGTVSRLRGEGVLVVEMEMAALFAVAAHRGARAAAIVAVSDRLGPSWHPGFHTLAYRRSLLLAADVALDTASRLSSSALRA